MNPTSPTSSLQPPARLGQNHGYRIDGDVAQLHAEVDVPRDPARAGHWALQLWACDAPHAGGPLSGVKVAETTVPSAAGAVATPLLLDAEARALLPGGQRDYAMVLVLASGEGGHFNQVHDFANYPARQRFVTPHLEGSVGYELDGEHVVLKADGVRSPRAHDNLSGSLSLELWALGEHYRGAAVEGHPLARLELGRLAGQCTFPAIGERVEFSPPPAGRWHVALMLREWSGAAGFITRDFAQFALPYETPAVPTVAPTAVPAAPPTAAPTASPAAPAAEASPLARPAARASEPTRVSVNGASAEQLAAVKGMSKKLASEIIKRRPYRALDDLLEVRGIGPKLLAALRPHITL